jgi:hypothetical protein
MLSPGLMASCRATLLAVPPGIVVGHVTVGIEFGSGRL